MPSFAGLGKFFGRTASEGAAFAAGVAVAPALSPVVREIVNEANSKYSSHPLSPGDAAAIVAEDVDTYDFGKAEASFNGVNEERFKALLGEVLNAPGIGELYTAFRRDLITEETFVHGLRKAKLETLWDAPLIAMKKAILDPAVLANIVVRGLAPDQGTLKVAPPTEVGTVPAYPVFNIDVLKEAGGAGLDFDHFAALVGIVGRPMSLHEAASAYFRGIIELSDYYRAVAEGDTRNEWRDAILEQARQIPSVTEGIEGRLRGWLTDAEMYAQTGRHGMSQADTDLLFKVHGRPISFHQTFIGLRRGGVYDGPVTGLDPAFLKALQESNIRPEWYNLAWAQRYSYPSAFVLRALTQGGDLTQAQTEQILLFEGWEPKLAATVAAKWSEVSPAKQDPAVKSAETKFLTALHKAFVGGAITDAQGVTEIALTSLSPEAQAGVLDYWRKEKALEAIPPPTTTAA